jgi:hypothetical protein
MIKIKNAGNQGHGPISKKVLSGIEKIQKRKVIDLSQFKEARLSAENLDKTVITDKEMAALDPVHAVYVYAQNKISVLSEQLGGLPELSKLVNAIADAQEEYMPSFPPMSPLTTSYFTCWGFFDLTTGIRRETFGAITIDLCRFLSVDENLITVFEHMQNSRMGFYRHEGFSGKHLSLREIMTGREITAISTSGYQGKAGQIWYVRIMPDPFPEIGYGYDVVFTTPYVIVEVTGKRWFGKVRDCSEKTWRDFFERNLPRTGIKDPIAAYESFMKYGLGRQQMNYRRPGMHYWNEYVFEGYFSHQKDMIILAGYPDIALSRPHSQDSEALMGE